MLIDFLFSIDVALLRLLNVTWQHPLLDQFWLTLTHLHKLTFVKAVLLPGLLAWLVYIYRWGALKLLLALGLAVAIGDSIAYRGFKSWVSRDRPLHDLDHKVWVRPIGKAHGPSFPSNHATNCFAGATILAWYFRRGRHFFYTLALFVALSRPALGVHYPSDILAGALLGIFVGMMFRFFVLNRYSWWRLDSRVSSSSENFWHWSTRSRRLRSR